VKTVLRYDRAALRSPSVTSQGFLKAEGYFGRAGIYEYRNDDGSIRYELRPPEEVGDPEALASYDGASVTVGHPAEEVNAENVRRHEVGTVSGEARMDGEHVAGGVLIKDARAIKAVKAGKQELSPGYRIDLDETPGADRRYATPSNPTGRYHAVQRKIRVNHLALVDRARGGSTVRLRMDAAEVRSDGGKLTTAVDGHQHLIDLCDWNGSPRWSGCTSEAMSDGASEGHEHPWVKHADGRVEIGESAGHTHAILDENGASGGPVPARADAEIDRSGTRSESGRMADITTDEQIRSLKAQLAEMSAKLVPLESAKTQAAQRADAADARVVTLTQENNDLRAQIASAAVEVETTALKAKQIRIDELEATVSRHDELFGAAVEARVELERKAAVVMGPEFGMRGLPDRQIVATVVKRLDAQQDTSPKVTDAYLRGRFDSLVELHARNARSSQRVGDLITQQNQQRADDLEERRAAYRNPGLEPLPNDPRARKGA
jgi:hypothetical protein